MSRQEVEILRRYFETWLGGDLRDLGDLSFLDSDVIYEDEILPEHVGETYHGPQGFRKAWARAMEPRESIEGEVEWIRDGDAVFSCHRPCVDEDRLGAVGTPLGSRPDWGGSRRTHAGEAKPRESQQHPARARSSTHSCRLTGQHESRYQAGSRLYFP